MRTTPAGAPDGRQKQDCLPADTHGDIQHERNHFTLTAHGSVSSLMPVLVVNGARAPIGAPFDRRIDRFVEMVNAAARDAALLATQTAVQTLGPNKRPAPSPRPGRNHSNRLKSQLQYTARDGVVSFNEAKANAQNPYWIIQEIGTGKKAYAREGGVKYPRGQAPKGAKYAKSVKSQLGRRISYRLVFADKGFNYSAPPGNGREQLQLASKVTGVPFGRQPLTINREIEGRHFIRDGSAAGFRKYQTSVLAAARQQFGGHPRP